jgi:hypothetical protein
MLTYPTEVIEKLKEHIDENEYAKAWLLKNDYEYLVKMADAAIYRDSKGVEYLLLHKHFVLVTFVNAIWEDKKALKILLDKKEFIWAAMSNFINGDQKAGIFLKQNKLDVYFSLAEKIQLKIRKLNDRNTNFFNSGPFKA